MLASDAVPEWTDSSCPLAWDHAGDPPRNPPPLPDPEPKPDEPDELEELHLDPQPDLESLPEEEELDCEWHGEGDLAHLHLAGECTMGETVGEVGGMPSPGHSSASSSVCLGTVEMEAEGPVLTAVGTLPPVLWRIASFNTSSAFLWLSDGGVCVRSRLLSPNHGC